MSKNDELLNIAGDVDIKEIKRLIEAGVDVNIANKHGKTALHRAAIYSYTEITNLMFSKTQNITIFRK